MADAFASGKGISPRKAMGMGKAGDGGGFDVEGYPGRGHKVSPDHAR